MKILDIGRIAISYSLVLLSIIFSYPFGLSFYLVKSMQEGIKKERMISHAFRINFNLSKLKPVGEGFQYSSLSAEFFA